MKSDQAQRSDVTLATPKVIVVSEEELVRSAILGILSKSQGSIP